ncbi:MAG: carboxylate-amine ligase [Gaiellaceae bacterium]
MSRLDAAPASVVEHAFGEGEPFTLGVEEEYMLLDPETFDLVPRVGAVLADTRAAPQHEQVAPELFESLLETHTSPCRTLADLHRELTALRRYIGVEAELHGFRVGCAGTHPFGLFERQRISAGDRYRDLIEELQYAGRRELVFGLHVHVGIDDPDRAIAVMRGLSLHLAELLALSASSPFWRGSPTGLASTRQQILSGFPRGGPPPLFRDYEDFVELVARLQATGCIEDYTRIWWDVRPHPRFGTVEMRVMDAVARVDDAAALAAYVQCLALRYARGPDGDFAEPVLRPLIAENKWRASRWGLDAELIDLDTALPRRVPVTRLVRRQLRRLAGEASELGCTEELDGIRSILARGNGARRQRLVYEANGDALDVARDIADWTET